MQKMARRQFELVLRIGARVQSSLGAALGNVQRGLQRTNRQIQATRRHSSKAFDVKAVDAMSSSLAVLGGALATVLSVQKVFDTADAWATVSARVGLVTNSVQQQKASLNQVYAIAQKTRQSYESTGDLYSKIAQNAKQLKIGNSQVLQITETVNKALTVGGGGAAQNEAAILQLSQALGSGKLQGDELRSLSENAPRLMKALANGLGVPTGALKKMGAQGKLTSAVVIKALQSQKKAVDSDFSKMPVTIRGAFTYANNAFGKFVDNTGKKTNVFNRIAKGIMTGTDWIFKNLEKLGNSKAFNSLINDAIKFGQVAIPKVKEFASYISNNWGTIKPIVEGITVALVALKAGLAVQGIITAVTASWNAYKIVNQGATIAQWALNAAMSANPIGLIAIGVAAAVAAGYYLWKNWDKVSSFLSNTWAKIKQGFASMINGMIDKINWLINKINLIPGVKVPLIPKIVYNAPQGMGDFRKTESKKVGRNAKGTNYWRGGPTWVSENGPELINLPRGSQVLNHSRTKSLLDSLGGGGIGGSVTFAPIIKIEGNADGNKVKEAMKMTFNEFKAFMKQYEKQKQRLVFDRG